MTDRIWSKTGGPLASQAQENTIWELGQSGPSNTSGNMQGQECSSRCQMGCLWMFCILNLKWGDRRYFAKLRSLCESLRWNRSIIHIIWLVVSNIFICIPIWGRFPFWLIFFRWVGSTTNQQYAPCITDFYCDLSLARVAKLILL